MVLAAGARLGRWLDDGPLPLAAYRAAAGLFAGTGFGRWTVSAISHGLWLAYMLGVLGIVVLLLSTREFTFTWETTILSARSYTTLTRTIATVPALLGFPTPGAEEIAGSRSGVDAATAAGARTVWAGLLLGSLVVYGALPRGLLLVVCLLLARRALHRFRLDTGHPGYARLRPRLLPDSRPTGIVDPDRGPGMGDQPSVPGPRPLALTGDGPVAILGVEIETPAAGWPPAVAGVDWWDLGVVDDRADRRRVAERIRSVVVPPRVVLTVFSLEQTPDRGTALFVESLREIGAEVAVVLSGGQRLRARGPGGHLARRLEDWRQLAAAAGVAEERVMELDLDHLTPASGERLRAWLGLGDEPRSPAVPIAMAFARIVEHVRLWRRRPDGVRQAELHRAIAQDYRGTAIRWPAALRRGVPQGAASVEQLRAGAEGMLALLPARLKRSSRWLSAGAIAGALGCVAAATLVAPAAIAALPAWAGLGAALSAVLHWTTAGEPAAPAAAEAEDCGEAVAAAALFALVLHLQGRDETAISDILDRVLDADEPPPIRDAAEAEAWLGRLEQRLTQALGSADGGTTR
jgi:hypothetical protein